MTAPLTLPIILQHNALNAAVAHRADGTAPAITGAEVLARARTAWDAQHEQGYADFTYHAADFRVCEWYNKGQLILVVASCS